MADLQLNSGSESLQEMITEMVELAKIPTATLNQLADQLQSLTGFPQAEVVESMISAQIPDEIQGSATRYAIRNIAPDEVDQVFEVIESWQGVDEENKAELPDDRLITLQKNLRAIVREYPALNRMRRALRLKTATGNEIKGCDFICEARPVHNNAGNDIDGFIPLVTFKIFYERQNLQQEEIEFVMTTEDLDYLLDQAIVTKGELDVLRTKLSKLIPDGCVDSGE